MSKYVKLSFIILFISAIIITGWTSQSTVGDDETKSQQYELKNKLSKGKKLTITYERILQTDVTVPSMPRHPPLKFYEKVNRKISQKILKIEDNRVTKTQNKYLQSITNPFKAKPKGKPDVLDKQTVKITKKDQEVVIDTNAKISKKTKESFSLDENNFNLFLPENKITIGDSWEVNSEFVTSVLRFTSTKKRMEHHNAKDIGITQKFDKGKITCALEEVKKIKGKETAIIKITGQIEGDDYGLKETISFEGSGQFLFSKGYFTNIELNGTIDLKGNQPCTRNRQVMTVGKGKFELKIKFK